MTFLNVMGLSWLNLSVITTVLSFFLCKIAYYKFIYCMISETCRQPALSPAIQVFPWAVAGTQTNRISRYRSALNLDHILIKSDRMNYKLCIQISKQQWSCRQATRPRLQMQKKHTIACCYEQCCSFVCRLRVQNTKWILIIIIYCYCLAFSTSSLASFLYQCIISLKMFTTVANLTVLNI